MRKAVRRSLVGAGVLVAVFALVLFYAAFFFDVNHYKPQIQGAVDKATGMDLRINGAASLKVFPRIRVALKDVHLFNRGKELFAAGEVQAAPQLIPYLFHHETVV